MPRKLLAVVVSSAFLMTSVALGAPSAPEPAPPPAPAAVQPAPAGNQPPLPPGRAINKAQGEEYDDLGMGVIIAAWAAALAVIFLVAFSNNGDEESAPTGTN